MTNEVFYWLILVQLKLKIHKIIRKLDGLHLLGELGSLKHNEDTSAFVNPLEGKKRFHHFSRVKCKNWS